jgi:hypothetical protein
VSDISAVICSENSQSETRQLDDIFRQLLRWKGFSGIILGSYADWKIDGNILYQGLCRERNFFLGGLVKWDRQSRLVYRTLQQGWHSYAPKKPASTPDDQSFEFPIFGLAIIAFILLYIRHNNIFRQKLKRAFAHSHGFFQDIRNGRFIGKSQTAFVGLVTAIVVALIVASLLYHYRCSSAFDYLLRHLLQGDGLDYNLIQIIWQPLLAILYVFIFALFSIIILTLAFKSASQLLGKRLPYGQSLVFILWSWAGFIWFSPATLLFYRALEMPLLRTVVLLGFLCFLLWGYFRSVNALKVVSTGGFFRAFIAMSTVHLLLLGIIVLFLHYYCGLFYYTDYFLKAII